MHKIDVDLTDLASTDMESSDEQPETSHYEIRKKAEAIASGLEMAVARSESPRIVEKAVKDNPIGCRDFMRKRAARAEVAKMIEVPKDRPTHKRTWIPRKWERGAGSLRQQRVIEVS